VAGPTVKLSFRRRPRGSLFSPPRPRLWRLDSNPERNYDRTVMKTMSPDTDPAAEWVLIQLLRQAPAWRRLQLADRMSTTVRELCLAGVRSRHPQASEAEVRRRFADIHLGIELAAKVYGPAPVE